MKSEISKADILRQKNIISEIRGYTATLSKTPLAFVDTYGCQQNESDSERLRGMLLDMGYELTRDEEHADVIVINTCAVREHAEKRVLGNVGTLTHLKRKKPNLIIALCGCMVQQPGMAEKIKSSYRHVDIIFGPQVLWRFPEFMQETLDRRRRVFSVEQEDGSIFEGLPRQRDSKVKAWLSIMYGCNNFCSYCIVPYVRGRERSRTPEDIMDEAHELVRAGYKDITLLGQNVNSYGKDLSEDIDFAELLKMINGIEGDFIIRFMTSHPKDATECLFAAMAECEKVARHIHLPFQAGNDRVLNAMNRRYTRSEYIALTELARKYMPDIVLTSDIIVGFPGETDEEFEDTLYVLDTVRFDALFTFIYSPRPGTPAAELPDPFTRQDKQRRFDRLLEMQNKISAEKHAEYVGKTYRVLTDGPSDDSDYPTAGRTNGGRLVRLRGDISEGVFVNVKITKSTTWSLYGELTEV